MGLKNEAQAGYGTKKFYQEYVSGMSRERFSKELTADTERLKEVYKEAVEDIERQQGQQLPGHIKFMRLFSNLAQRLNPTRRLIFGLGSVSFVAYYILNFFGILEYVLIGNLLLPFGFLSMFMLLLIELLEKSDVQKEIDLAREIQLSLLPGTSLNKKNLEIYSFAHTAKEVGGDYLDVIETDKGTYVVIADVSGKGLSAALYMVRLQALVNLIVERDHPTPKELFLQLNNYIKSNSKDKTFVTGCVAFFPNDEDHFEYIRAGHNIPIYYNRERDTTYKLKSNGFALGMTSTKMLGQNLEVKKFHFKPGDSVLFYTDGLNEARNERGEEYGEERIESLMEIYGSLHAKTIIGKLQSSLEAFIGGVSPLDDVTFTCIHHPGKSES
ncbi:PP2C family protein-serine/threonine phosphatase [Gracilimonas mengyeensis]|uniref:Stage II sporulation protein E (SpoIIE) n=1 Tax=Gracilimonas mengyeensis TaxID=1302730 RepID=A0A521EQB7_9BACT|nr:PP2C family protein-serine/threonine phosphatase [Gracilimonas mengyeensis]SMO86085.1 Stage II sporulation protein E (SpoIIE) [Gracilimonas mengyeensis]